MDISDARIPNISIQPGLALEKEEFSLNIPKLPTNLTVGLTETESSNTLKKTSTSINFTSNKNKKNLLDDFSNFDDSFDVFVPLKNKSTKETSIDKSEGKKKPRANKIKNRLCPYFKTKSVKQFFKPASKSKEDEDLKLALARSLVDFSGISEISSKPNSEAENKLTLEQNKEFKLKNWNGKISKKQTKSILSRRTEEDRNRIITQKIAIILLETKGADCCESREVIELASYFLQELLDKNSSLWELSKKSVEDTDFTQFYVSSLKNFMNPPISSPRKNLETDLPHDQSEVYKREGINEMEVNIAKLDNLSERRSPDISIHDNENNHSTLESLQTLSDDWSNFYGNSKFSDIDVVLQDGILQCHKLVFAVRCPDIIKDINSLYTPHALDLSQYSLKAAKVFLKYIYSGRISDLHSLNDQEKEDIYVLTKKYNLSYLQTLALPTPDDVFYNQSTCSPPNNSEDSVDTPDQLLDCKASSSEHLYDSCISNVLPVKKANITDSFPESTISSGFNNREGLSKTNCYKRKSSSANELIKFKKVCSENSGLVSNINAAIPEIVNLDSDSDGTDEIGQQDGFNFGNISKECLTPNLANEANNAYNSHDDDSLFDSIHYDFDANELNNTGGNDPVIEKSSKNKDLLQDNSVSSNLNGAKKHNIKSSLDVYLETSFPSFNEDLGIGMASSPKNVSTPQSAKVFSNYRDGSITPSNDLIIKDGSPLADYSGMDSPILKNELSKFGLKQNIGRKKSKMLLKYIYDQLHPSTSQLTTCNSPIPSTSRDHPSPTETVDLDSDTS